MESRSRGSSTGWFGGRLVGALLVGLAALPGCDGSGPSASSGTPEPVRSKSAPSVPPGGGFVEEGRDAGLNFRMAFLPGEQGEKFKINLYDHGAGVALADVDGDLDDDIYLLNQLGPNGLFRNEGSGRFTDITSGAGVALGDRICVAAVFGDVDSDGDQDLYVTSTRGGNVFFRNDGRARFTDVTQEAGLALVAHSQSPTLFDADSDGDLDLFVTNTAKWTWDQRDPSNRYWEGRGTLFDLVESPIEQNVLYENDGRGRFTDVTERAGVGGVGWGGDTAVLDYDEDGRPDLLVGNMFGSSVLYRNEGGGKFADVTRAVLGRTSWGTVGVKAFDYDGDARLDLMLVDMHSDMWMPYHLPVADIDEHRKFSGPEGPNEGPGSAPPQQRQELRDRLHVRQESVIFGNTLFRNLGGGKFEEASERAGVETLWPWGVAAADFDLNGAMDAFIPSGMGHPYGYWRSYLLMGRGDGSFEDRARDLGIDPPPGGAFLEGRIGGLLAARSARSAAVADLDGDGRPDLVVNNFNDRAHLFRNYFPNRSWVAFRLTGTRSNRDAVGALVTIRSDGKAQIRQVEAAGGYLAQSSKTVHFGLAGAAKLDACEIRWPSGIVQKPADVRLNAVNAIVEPAQAAGR